MNYKGILLTVFVIFMVFLIGIEVTINYTKAWEEECNNRFGKDGWKLIETTGKHPFYIGQTWECVKGGF